MKKIWISILAMFSLVLLAGCNSNAQTSNNNEIKVVTSLNFYGEIAKDILGKDGNVTSIINSSSVDPHDFEPTPADAKKVSGANLVIANGLGYDEWFNKMADNSDAIKIDVAQGIAHKKDGDNEHIWYDLDTITKLANRLTDEFSKMKPKQKDTFIKNRDKFLADLVKIQDKEKQIKNKLNGQSVAVTEPVFNYPLQKMGAKIVDEEFAKAIDDGTDPKPNQLSDLQEVIRDKKIKLLVFNTQTSGAIVDQIVKLAEKNNIALIRVTETKPQNKTYFAWLNQQYDEIIDILN